MGSGPTVGRAIAGKDRFYLSTVIQLSLLGWVHGRSSLAITLAESMERRYELKVEGASPDPTYEGIVGTLEACTSQTSSMKWSDYIQSVELRIRQTCHDFQYQKDYVCLAPTTILAGMDYLCMVQKWSESRIMVVHNQKGFLTLIVWAYHLLGLSTLVKGIPGGDVYFRKSEARSPQVIIIWAYEGATPDVCLLDSKMELVLETSSDDIKLRELDACERLPLRNFGAILLRREMNKPSVSSDDNCTDPAILESVQHVVAMAIITTGKLRRLKDTNDTRRQGSLECWQMYDAASLIFGNLRVDVKGINAYLDLVKTTLSEVPSLFSLPLPRALDAYLKKLDPKNTGSEPLPFHKRLMRLAAVVVVFASVPEITGCADLPLIADLGNIEGIEFVSHIQFNEGLVHYEPSGLFYPLCQMLVGFFFTTHEDGNSFMVSNFGWTVYLPSFGDHDPVNTVPERLLVKKGVPTNTKTGERKFRVRDMTNVLESGMMPCRRVTDRGINYVPRCLSRVVKRTEYYGSRQNSFDLDIAFEVAERLDSETESRKFELNMSYRSFHDSLWGTFFTPSCSHLKVDARGKCAITKLGPGIAAGTGLD